jgi:hypothetical protein
LDDRVVHAVGGLLGEADADIDESGCRQTFEVFGA